MSFQIAQALAHFLWQGVAIAAVLLLLLHVLRAASARYNACAVALALMCASPVATFLYLASRATALPGTHGMILSTALPSTATVPASWFEENATRLFYLWLTGALFLLVRAAWAWWRARCVVTRSVERLSGRLEASARRLAVQLGANSVQFRLSARVASALVFGWLKPIVVLPAAALGRLTEAEIEALLAHELAHVVRCDFLVNLLQTAAECVLFYHPLVWWVSARMREERELCCDDFAVAVCRDEILYSKALLRLEELRMEPALAATGGRLSLRIRRLLGGPESSRIAVAPALAFLLVFGVSVALLAQKAPPAPPQPPAPPSAVEPAAPPAPPAGPVESQTVYRAGDDISMPRPVYKVEPEYTDAAHAAHVEGTVLLSTVISAEGRATEIKVVKSLDKGLDANTIVAVRAWKFEPGLKNGKPVPVIAHIETNFRLSDGPPPPPVAPVASTPAAAPTPAVAPAPPTPPSAAPHAAPAPPATPLPAVASEPAVAPLPPEPPESPEAVEAAPAPPAPPSNGVVRGVVGGVPGGVRSGKSTGVVGGVLGGVRAEIPGGVLAIKTGGGRLEAADFERAALELERLQTATERQAAAAERAEVVEARQKAQAALQAEVAKASEKVSRSPGSQQAMDELNRKVAELTRLEEEKARAEVVKSNKEVKIAALQAELARASAERSRVQAEAGNSAQRESSAREAELKRRQAYAAARFGGENPDRGKAYVKYGPPDEIESHPSTGTELWRYKDASKSKVTLDLEFRDGKQVRSTGGTAVPDPHR